MSPTTRNILIGTVAALILYHYMMKGQAKGRKR